MKLRLRRRGSAAGRTSKTDELTRFCAKGIVEKGGDACSTLTNWLPMRAPSRMPQFVAVAGCQRSHRHVSRCSRTCPGCQGAELFHRPRRDARHRRGKRLRQDDDLSCAARAGCGRREGRGHDRFQWQQSGLLLPAAMAAGERTRYRDDLPGADDRHESGHAGGPPDRGGSHQAREALPATGG